MNKKKKPIKKFTFEPKVPTQKIEEVKHEDIPCEIQIDTFTTKGKFCPIQSLKKKFNYKYNPDDNIILNIPYIVNNVELVVFEDDSCGLKIEDKILHLECVPVENDVVFDNGFIEVGSVKYYLVPSDIMYS